ncbi:hypothetical protein GGR54DRAFT_594499 [Hypoxylon sp. NC1633]|nr:hypothetical protein GGR54DRAFT_594499 [Hypoxylon sp. NC1633]
MQSLFLHIYLGTVLAVSACGWLPDDLGLMYVGARVKSNIGTWSKKKRWDFISLDLLLSPLEEVLVEATCIRSNSQHIID